MPRIIFISGACGCGKTTFANAYAKHLVRMTQKTVYVIHGDDFHRGYIVLTADASEVERRIRNRGDIDLIERALFLKNKLETMYENQGHLYNNTGKTPEDMIAEIELRKYLVEDRKR